MIFIGIDPGLGGALAFLDDSKVVTALHDMPVTGKPVGKGMMVDAFAVAELIEPLGEAVAVVEAVSARPGQGVTSMFSFGESVGVLRGILAARKIPHERVAPGAWKRKAGLMGKSKDAARGVAGERHPEIANLLTRKKDHGRAEAVLLADYIYDKLGRPE